MSVQPKLSRWQLVGYGAGDLANNLAFSMTTAFLLVYYTDVVHLNAADVGTLFLVVRVWDAFADIFAGRLVDGTMTRWGKFKPFIMIFSLPLMALTVATFTVPAGLSGEHRLIYAYVTYALLGLVYSLVNIPYGSLAAAMTQDPQERAKLASFRMVGGALALIVLYVAVSPRLQKEQGQALDTGGVQSFLTLATLGFGVIGLACYFLLLRTAREAVERDVATVSLRQSVHVMRHNPPLLLLCLSSLAFLTATYGLQAMYIYYARDVLGDSSYMIWLGALAVVGIAVFAPLAPRMVRRLGKKRSYVVMGGVGIAAALWISAAPPSTPALPLGGFALMGIAIAGISTLMWALEADTVEYGEARTGLRTEGMTYALFSFTRKMGQAFGGFVAGHAIAFGGYDGDAPAQSAQALDWIRYASGYIPAIFIALAVLAMAFYPLTEARYMAMVEETARRRREAQYADALSPGSDPARAGALGATTDLLGVEVDLPDPGQDSVSPHTN